MKHCPVCNKKLIKDFIDGKWIIRCSKCNYKNRDIQTKLKLL